MLKELLRSILTVAGIAVFVKFLMSLYHSLRKAHYSRKYHNRYDELLNDPRSKALLQEITSTRFKGNNMFTHEVVAITGLIPGMKLTEAKQKVLDNGGEIIPYIDPTATMLVVGNEPDTEALDDADILSIRTITADEFIRMTQAPVTLSRSEFESVIEELKKRL